MIINANTKISKILKHNPDALEAIISINPKFEKLRNPLLRKLMAARTSIGMASKIGGFSVEEFFDKLQPLGFEPLLVIGFYQFDFGWPTQLGAILINGAIIYYLINIGMSIVKSKKENVHAVFVFTGTLRLMITIIVGLLLVYNFNYNILSKDSLSYLPLHAHLGIVGWFLLLVIGVGSRLIPLFLISNYDNKKILWWIYALINLSLISFIVFFLFFRIPWLYLLPLLSITTSIILFAYYCYQAYHQRIRKKVDYQVKISLLSVMMMALPLIFLLIVIVLLLFSVDNMHLILTYGFCIFFGWITAIIFGMTFKTLPFIV